MAEQQEGEWAISIPSDGQVVQFNALSITASAGGEETDPQPSDPQPYGMVVLL